MKEIEQLQSGETVAVCDYMMKLLLQKFREPQRDWYAKKGVSLHGTMFFHKSSDSGEIEVEIHDLYSNGDCVQNWFFTISAFEATFKNFAAKHDDIKKLSIWSDNGPHYHNTSVIVWLMRFSEMCPMKIVRYSFFEAQKGKTSLDSHFATFKFVLKGWMKQGNDILQSKDIVDGTADHLKGTHVYEITIDRTKEPKSANTWNGITRFGSFTYIHDGDECIAIVAREQSNHYAGERFTKERLFKLWKKFMMSDNVSSGVTSDFNIENYKSVEPRLMKTQKSKKERQCSKIIEQDTDCEVDGCPKCGRNFLRPTWLAKHVETCSMKDRERKKKTAKEIRESLPVKEALGSATKQRKLAGNRIVQTELNTDLQSFYKMLLKGSATKQGSKKSNKFTAAQKEIMKWCFHEGECDKRKRFIPSQCQELLKNKLGEDLVLKEAQIKNYWSAYKRKKLKLQHEC